MLKLLKYFYFKVKEKQFLSYESPVVDLVSDYNDRLCPNDTKEEEPATGLNWALKLHKLSVAKGSVSL